MNIVREQDEIRKSLVELDFNRDELVEWLLQNTKESYQCRVYVGRNYIQVGIDRIEEEPNE